MSYRVPACAALVLAALPWSGADARGVEHKGAGFRLDLPDAFAVTKTAAGIRGFSKAGNLKVFARAQSHAAKTYDFNGHFARWEGLAKQRGFYRSLRRVTERRQVGKGGHTAVFRVYDAIGVRKKTHQPYRVITLATFGPAQKRVYTLAIAAHFDAFARHRAQIDAIAKSFSPVRGFTPQRKVSLRGRLAVRNGKLVAVRGAPRALASAVTKSALLRPVARRAAPRPSAAATKVVSKIGSAKVVAPKVVARATPKVSTKVSSIALTKAGNKAAGKPAKPAGKVAKPTRPAHANKHLKNAASVVRRPEPLSALVRPKAR